MGSGSEVEGRRRRKKHMVLVPFMAQGHFSAFLSLAKLLDEARPGAFTITIVSTQANVGVLRSALLSAGSSEVDIKVLPFHSAEHGLPPGAENTDCLPYSLIMQLLLASHSLRPHFDAFIADVIARDECPPFCIVADFLFGWTVEVARKHGVFHATYSTGGAFGFAAYYSIWLHLPHLNTEGNEDEEFRVPGFPQTYWFQRDQMSEPLRRADGKEPWFGFLREQIALALDSDGMLCNTLEEMEKTGLEALRRINRNRVWPVGPLVIGGGGPRLGKETGISIEDCLQWLDDRPKMSVIYVSFGSQNTISLSQMRSLAAALESSTYPFLWVVRPPFGFDPMGEFRIEWLPEGFEERVRKQGRGLVVRKWAPQMEILAHKAVGAFLTHCGWNSVIESLSEGVPMLGWPMAAEQFYNAKMLVEEMGVCVELARGPAEALESGVVAALLREVMGGEKGTEMRRRAAQAKEVMRSAAATDDGKVKRGSSLAALDDFFETARSHDRRHRSSSAAAP